MSKKRLAALGASAASAALVGSALFAPSALADDGDAPHSPSAFAIGANGLLNVEQTPYVEDDDGEKTTANIPANPLAEADVLQASSNQGESSSKVAGLKLIDTSGVDVPGVDSDALIDADLITASCEQGEVDSDIANLEIAGKEIPMKAGDNTAVLPEPLDGLLDVQLNQQVENDDGSSTVNAVKITVANAAANATEGTPILGKLAGQTITLASATCADTGDDGDGDDGDGDDGDGDNGDGDNGDGDNGDGDNGGGDNGGGDNGGDNGGGGASTPNDDGSAPQPEPQPGHVAVTG